MFRQKRGIASGGKKVSDSSDCDSSNSDTDLYMGLLKANKGLPLIYQKQHDKKDVSYNDLRIQANTYVILPGQKLCHHQHTFGAEVIPNSTIKNKVFKPKVKLEDDDDNSDCDDNDTKRTLPIQELNVYKSKDIGKIKDVETPKSIRKGQPVFEEVRRGQDNSNYTMLSPDVRTPEVLKRKHVLNSLIIRGIPIEVTVEELKKKFPNILNVNVPQQTGRYRPKTYYAFVEFESKKKAEENYSQLKNQKLRGQMISVNFADQRKTRPTASTKVVDNTSFNKKELVVTGYPNGATISKFSSLFPRAVSIYLSCRSTSILFKSEQSASEALAANTKTTIGGKKLSISFARQKPHLKKNQFKQKQKKQPSRR